MKTDQRTTVFLGLGGNLQDPLATFRQARQALMDHPAITNCQSSPLYQTPAVGGPGGQPDYLNAVLSLNTLLNPQDLLTLCQNLENAAGRERTIHWGARTLDIDLLLFGSLIIQETCLEVPHPHMTERRFVLEPLVALAPKSHHPVSGLALKTHLQQLPAIKNIRLLKENW
ncbi:MAG: 2-amino-4-hydroxy-6-hydroxymethyldihydropteridine diphosphokinase [Geopsychrobacter sp.]|nr:2-amino-4-hydroxy-6-hydroxymethyldihydropteridine diphosphokinase [Geopsychrobacter sp.]